MGNVFVIKAFQVFHVKISFANTNVVNMGNALMDNVYVLKDLLVKNAMSKAAQMLVIIKVFAIMEFANVMLDTQDKTVPLKYVLMIAVETENVFQMKQDVCAIKVL